MKEPVPEHSLEKVPSEEPSLDNFFKVLALDEKIATAKAIQEIAMQSILFAFVLIVAGALFWAGICFASDIIKQHNELAGFFDPRVIFVLTALLVPPTLFLFALLRAVFPKNSVEDDSKKAVVEDSEERLLSLAERLTNSIKELIESMAEKYIRKG